MFYRINFATIANSLTRPCPSALYVGHVMRKGIEKIPVQYTEIPT